MKGLDYAEAQALVADAKARGLITVARKPTPYKARRRPEIKARLRRFEEITARRDLLDGLFGATERERELTSESHTISMRPVAFRLLVEEACRLNRPISEIMAWALALYFEQQREVPLFP